MSVSAPYIHINISSPVPQTTPIEEYRLATLGLTTAFILRQGSPGPAPNVGACMWPILMDHMPTPRGQSRKALPYMHILK